MHLEPYTQMHWAYQLHYYLCFQTNRRRARFISGEQTTWLQSNLADVCSKHDYHLLGSRIYANHVRCLVSLRPNQAIATVMQKIKSVLSREYRVSFSAAAPLWARGYLAHSVGRVLVERVKRYLDQQPRHHGYDRRLRPPVFRCRAKTIPRLTAAHAVFDLAHHLVFATRYRVGVFDSAAGESLTKYWVKVAAKRGFAIAEVSFVPDHVHLIVKIAPKMSIEDCALAWINNGQYFAGRHFPQLLVQAGLPALWQPSGYAGTCGRITTAGVKSFLSREE
jgi:putative transposase